MQLYNIHICMVCFIYTYFHLYENKLSICYNKNISKKTFYIKTHIINMLKTYKALKHTKDYVVVAP